jgi:hypothetical protein
VATGDKSGPRLFPNGLTIGKRFSFHFGPRMSNVTGFVIRILPAEVEVSLKPVNTPPARNRSFEGTDGISAETVTAGKDFKRLPGLPFVC